MTQERRDRRFILSVLPHGPGMCLLDQVERSGPGGICCRGVPPDQPSHPLARDGLLAAVCAVEYAAQATAVHGALNAEAPARPRPGVIASVRDLRWDASHLGRQPGPLRVECESLASGPRHCSYRFRVADAGGAAVTGQLMVMFGDGGEP